ncbi:hypothetical protein ECANGB1_2687 [Enterospora canceri]|uniref:Uncharacterized protein n=1 Tax=Enterospora canceri TaxID=1081671 RepID=A0A1Y1S9D6_9MICR|nr:hypothetical protein ECANGB1_2687 [Enterospora canceri]
MLLLSIGFVFSASHRETSVVGSLIDICSQSIQLAQTKIGQDEEISELLTTLNSQFSDFANVGFDDKEKMVREQYDEFITRINQMDVNQVNDAISEYENSMLLISINYSSLDDVEAKHSELSSSIDKLKEVCELYENQKKELLKCCLYCKMVKLYHELHQQKSESGRSDVGILDDNSHLLEVEHFYFDDSGLSSDTDMIGICKVVNENVCKLVDMRKELQVLRAKRNALIQDCVLSTKTLN